jgi:hypothetical protein
MMLCEIDLEAPGVTPPQSWSTVVVVVVVDAARILKWVHGAL